MGEAFSRYDMADYLKTDEDVAEYLSLVLADGDSDSDEFVRAIGHVARARGMPDVAFPPGSQPSFYAVLKALHLLGLGLHVESVR